MKERNNLLQKEENNVVNMDDFKKDLILPATGGKDGGQENWLANLVPGTCFLSRARNARTDDPELAENHVVFQTDTTTLLVTIRQDGQQFRRHVDSLRFSRQNFHFKTLGVSLPEEEQEENNNGNSDPIQ